MKAPAEKPHLSATQLDMFCRCGESYRRSYINGEKIPPGIALLKGSSFHVGAEANMRQKIESHKDLPAKEVVAIAVSDFEAQAHGGLTLTEEEVGRGADNVVGDAKDDLAELADVHAKKQAKDYQPVFAEEKIRIVLPDSPRDLIAVLDVADDQDRVIDFKTSGKRKSQSEADTSVQLTIYSAAFHAKVGRAPADVRLDTIVQTKRTIDRQVLVSDRNEHDFSALAHRINAVNHAIQAGSFPPASPGSWHCAPKWCGFWHTCPYVNSERRARADDR